MFRPLHNPCVFAPDDGSPYELMNAPFAVPLASAFWMRSSDSRNEKPNVNKLPFTAPELRWRDSLRKPRVTLTLVISSPKSEPTSIAHILE
jgi:hypothetical protein